MRVASERGAERVAAERAGKAGRRGQAGKSFFILLFLFLAAYVSVTVLLSTSFHVDEAEQILFSQSVAAGYEAQPPLYSWLLQLLFAIFGRGFFAFALLKALSLGAVFLGLYAAARTMLADEARASLAAFSIFLIPLFAWSAVGYLSHTVLVAAACTWTCFAVLRLHDNRRYSNYLLLGFVVALGVLTKYNYLLFAAAILLAAVTIRAYRVRLLDRRMLLAVALTAALVWPHAVYVAGHWQVIAGILLSKAEAVGASVHGPGKAARDLVTNMVLILAPLGAAAAIFFPAVFRRSSLTAADPARRRHSAMRLLERYFVALLCLLLLVIAAGAKRFNDRWLQPFVLVAPLYLFGRLRGVTLPAGRVRGFAAALAVCAAAVIVVRAGQLLLGGSPSCSYALGSFGAAAARLQVDLGPRAVTVCSQRDVSGNLCFWLPALRHFCSERPMYLPARGKPRGRCALVWGAPEGEALPFGLREFVSEKWHLRIPATPVQSLVVRSPRGQEQRLRYMVLPADSNESVVRSQ